MLKDIVLILTGIAGIFAFNYIRSKIISKGKTILSDNLPAIKKIEEEFNASKLKAGLTNLTNKVGWAKTLTQEFSLRTWIVRIGIVLVVLSAIYAYGVWKGKQGLQPILNLEGKEEWIRLNNHLLHVKKEGTLEVTELDKKTVLKKITVKDLTNLRQILKPFGFQKDFIGILGYGVGLTGNKPEIGAGVAYFKAYNWRTDISITNRAVYPLGVSYKITENSGVGASYGYGFKKDSRILLKYIWDF